MGRRDDVGVVSDGRRRCQGKRHHPPYEEFKSAHSAWMEGIESYDWVAKNMAVAIQGPDYDLLNESTARLASASASFKRAMTLMPQASTP